MAGGASPISNAVAPVLESLDQTGIERAKAVEAVQLVAGFAQHEIVSNGGVGAADEVLALLIAACKLVMGHAMNHQTLTWEQLTAQLKRGDGPALRVVKG